jgi:hypothetical protein
METVSSIFLSENFFKEAMRARSSARLERRTLKPENGEEIRRSRVQFPSGPPSNDVFSHVEINGP